MHVDRKIKISHFILHCKGEGADTLWWNECTKCGWEGERYGVKETPHCETKAEREAHRCFGKTNV